MIRAAYSVRVGVKKELSDGYRNYSSSHLKLVAHYAISQSCLSLSNPIETNVVEMKILVISSPWLTDRNTNCKILTIISRFAIWTVCYLEWIPVEIKHNWFPHWFVEWYSYSASGCIWLDDQHECQTMNS